MLNVLPFMFIKVFFLQVFVQSTAGNTVLLNLNPSVNDCFIWTEERLCSTCNLLQWGLDSEMHCTVHSKQTKHQTWLVWSHAGVAS